MRKSFKKVGLAKVIQDWREGRLTTEQALDEWDRKTLPFHEKNSSTDPCMVLNDSGHDPGQNPLETLTKIYPYRPCKNCGGILAHDLDCPLRIPFPTNLDPATNLAFAGATGYAGQDALTKIPTLGGDHVPGQKVPVDRWALGEIWFLAGLLTGLLAPWALEVILGVIHKWLR